MLAAIEKTGQFELAVEKWRAETVANYHTWAQFQINFKKADTERKRKITAQTGGYAGANIGTTSRPPLHSANHTHDQCSIPQQHGKSISASRSGLNKQKKPSKHL